jgi:hypothetical protein
VTSDDAVDPTSDPQADPSAGDPEEGSAPTELPPPSAPIADPAAGRPIIRASLGGTVVFTVLAGLAVAVDVVVPVFVIVSLLMFAAGCVLFVVAFLAAVDRSRTEAIGIGGLFFGAGSTPPRVQLLLMGSLAIEVVVGVAAAVIRLYTAVAFGTLAPMWALGLAGLWTARFGRFPARTPELTRAGQREVERRQAAGRPSPSARPARAARPEDPPASPG